MEFEEHCKGRLYIYFKHINSINENEWILINKNYLMTSIHVSAASKQLFAAGGEYKQLLTVRQKLIFKDDKGLCEMECDSGTWTFVRKLLSWPQKCYTHTSRHSHIPERLFLATKTTIAAMLLSSFYRQKLSWTKLCPLIFYIL